MTKISEKSMLFQLQSAYKIEDILLEKLSQTHILALHELFSNPENIRFTDNEPHESIVESEIYFKDYEADMLAGRNIAFLISVSGEMCGHVRFYNADSMHKFLSFGIFCKKENRRKGIAELVLRTLCSEIFSKTDFNRIEAQTFTENTAGIALLEKLGMQREGRLRQNFCIDGSLRDSFLYAVLKQDFKYSEKNS